MLTLDIIGKRISQIREGKGLNQVELCEKLKAYHVDISRETLSKIENGSRSISAVEIKAICAVLSISSEELLSDTEDDLVTLFRKLDVGEQAIAEVDALQNLIKDFTAQKKLHNGEYKVRKGTPLWR